MSASACGRVPEHDARFDAEDLTVEAAEVPVAPRVGPAQEPVVRAIHFDDQPQGRREEIDDDVPRTT